MYKKIDKKLKDYFNKYFNACRDINDENNSE